jgi:hypothetical protein
LTLDELPTAHFSTGTTSVTLANAASHTKGADVENRDARATTFSVYLLREDRVEAEEVLRPAQRAAYEEVPVTLEGYRGVRAFLRPEQRTPPDWARALRGHVPDRDLSRLQRSASSLVVVAPVRGRLVALTFGMGWSALDPDAVEPGFGLRLGARTIDGSQVRHLEVHSLDGAGRVRTDRFAAGQSITSLAPDRHGAQVRRLGGRTRATGARRGARRATGADGYRFPISGGLERALDEVAEYLDQLGRTEGAPEFAFLDDLVPLRRGSRRREQLDRELVALLAAGDLDGTALTSHDAEVLDRLDHVEVRAGRLCATLPELDLRDVLALLAGGIAVRHLDTVQLRAVDARAAMAVSPATTWAPSGRSPTPPSSWRRRSLVSSTCPPHRPAWSPPNLIPPSPRHPIRNPSRPGGATRGSSEWCRPTPSATPGTSTAWSRRCWHISPHPGHAPGGDDRDPRRERRGLPTGQRADRQ